MRYETGACKKCGAVGYPCGQFRLHDPDGDWVGKRMLHREWTANSCYELRCRNCR